MIFEGEMPPPEVKIGGRPIKEEKHRCEVCGKYFARDLKRHMMTHTGERPFQCSYCPNVPRFRLKAHLKSHFRTQHGFEATNEELEAAKIGNSQIKQELVV